MTSWHRTSRRRVMTPCITYMCTRAAMTYYALCARVAMSPRFAPRGAVIAEGEGANGTLGGAPRRAIIGVSPQGPRKLSLIIAEGATLRRTPLHPPLLGQWAVPIFSNAVPIFSSLGYWVGALETHPPLGQLSNL